MIDLDVRSNIDEVLRRVDDRVKKIPIAASNALNTTAFMVKKFLPDEMKRVLDRPTSYTQNAFFVRRASVGDLAAAVYLKESNAGKHYLRPNIYGGARLPKGFELVLRQRGLLPAGMFAVPSEGAKIDAFGNMSRGQLLQVMSALQLAERTAGYSANRSELSKKRRGRKLPQFFVGKPSPKAPLGVWQRSSFLSGKVKEIKPVLVFVRQPMYKARFNFHRVAEQVARKAFPLHFERELKGIPTGRGLGL